MQMCAALPCRADKNATSSNVSGAEQNVEMKGVKKPYYDNARKTHKTGLLFVVFTSTNNATIYFRGSALMIFIHVCLRKTNDWSGKVAKKIYLQLRNSVVDHSTMATFDTVIALRRGMTQSNVMLPWKISFLPETKKNSVDVVPRDHACLHNVDRINCIDSVSPASKGFYRHALAYKPEDFDQFGFHSKAITVAIRFLWQHLFDTKHWFDLQYRLRQFQAPKSIFLTAIVSSRQYRNQGHQSKQTNHHNSTQCAKHYNQYNTCTQR